MSATQRLLREDNLRYIDSLPRDIRIYVFPSFFGTAAARCSFSTPLESTMSMLRLETHHKFMVTIGLVTSMQGEYDYQE